MASLLPAAGLVWCVLASSALAQEAAPPAQSTPETGTPVVYRGQEIVRIYRGLGAMGPAERARLTSTRLNRFVQDPDFDPTRVTVIDRETHSEFIYDDQVLGVVTDDDARAVGRSRTEYAREVRERLVRVVQTTREEFSAWSIIVGLVWTALATVILAFLLALVTRIGRRARARVIAWFQPLTDPSAVAMFQTTPLGTRVHGAVTTVTVVVMAMLAVAWVELVLQVLPWSRPLARTIYRYVADPIRALWFGLLAIVPNLFYLVVIALTTALVLKAVRLVFSEIENGNIRLASFPADWAEPTYKLVRAFLLAVALVGAFPYIPGSQSPAFQGIAVLLGVLLSLSSSSTLSNIIAGASLTYTRAFRLGDIVRIGDTFGKVIVKHLLVTHVRTYKNVVVSIPNSVILTTQVLNYTTLAAERGLVAHTSVTIGYDTPWRTVYELLIAAALRTEGVLDTPAPFVLQTSLNNFSVTYEVNAFVGPRCVLPDLYSALHTHIQECFNEAGVEIMSPNYYALRDGNDLTTPKQRIPAAFIRHDR